MGLEERKQRELHERVSGNLKTIETAAQGAASVVRRLQELYRPRGEEEASQLVDLHEVISKAISLSQARWKDQAQGAGVTITVETDLQPVPTVLGSQEQIRDALVNLIFNAVDAIVPPGGGITIGTRREAEYVVLQVSDTGSGMTEEVRQRCLEPFFSTKRQQGTGLGLAMVWSTVQRHRGAIDIETELGRGTTFTLRLPVDGQLPLSTESRDAEGRKERMQTPYLVLHVLVVDDEPLIREIVAKYLEGDGHTVEIVANGLEALERFQAGEFDLVITDRAMPNMDGEALAAAIKGLKPDTPVILLTGFGGFIDQSQGPHASVDMVVDKPIGIVEFRSAVAKVLGWA